MPDISPDLAELLKKIPPPTLGPGLPMRAAEGKLRAVLPMLTLGCQSGLWLAFGFWAESHDVAQNLPTPEGSFWHAILHRREPDAWNSKYWFRQVGAHPVFERLVEQAPALGYDYRHPSDFVDFCEQVRDTGSVDEAVACRVQELEWRLLFDHCI